MEQLLNKAGDVFVSQFMRLGTSTKLLEIAGPLDKDPDSVSSANNVETQDEHYSVAMKEPEAGEKPDSVSSTKEPSDSVEPGLESSSKPSDLGSKPKDNKPESVSKELDLESSNQLGLEVNEGETDLTSSEKPGLEASQALELVASGEQNSEFSMELDLEPSQQPDLTSSKEPRLVSDMELELDVSESKIEVEAAKDLSVEEPVRFHFFL